MIDKRVARVSVVRHELVAASRRADVVVGEEPLEIRVAGDVVATTMRTPGDDRALALGFLFAERVIQHRDDVGSIYPCGRLGDARYGNAIDVIPGPGARLDIERLERGRRAGITSSACGVCGRDAIDDLLEDLCPSRSGTRVSESLIERAPKLLSLEQPVFARTGGLHAACALTAQASIVAHAEDVGRHNAVDKVVGQLLLAQQLPRDVSGSAQPVLLAVSGRASFEIIQKAAVAGFVCVASVSAPSSLAVQTAEALGITLASFVRGSSFTVYSHPERVIA